MADLITTGTAEYATGSIDSATTLVSNVSPISAKHPNGLASAVVQIETVLGSGTVLRGSTANLGTRLDVLLQSSGTIKDKDNGTSYTKWDGWNGYGTATLAKRRNANPPGEIILWSFTAIPTGFLELNSSQQSCTTLEDLFDVALADLDTPGTTAQDWRRGTANHTLAQATDINITTETLTKTAHGLSNGTVVHVSSSTTIPPGLATKTKYYLVGVTTDTYKLSTTLGGSAIDITGLGSGTLSVFTTFQLPDWRGRSPIGAGTGSGLTNRALNTAYGVEVSQLLDHNHIQRTGDNTGNGIENMTYWTSDTGSGANAKVATNGATSVSAGDLGAMTVTSAGVASPDNLHPSVGCRYLVRY